MKRRPSLRLALALSVLALTVSVAGCRPIRIPSFRPAAPPPRMANLPKFEVPRFNPPRFEPPPFRPPPPIPRPLVIVPPPAPRVSHVPEAAAPQVPDAALEQTLRLANNKNWTGLSKHLDTVETIKLPPGLRPSVTALHESGRELQTLTTLEGLLAAEARPGSLAKAADLARGSPKVHEPVSDLASLEGLQALLKTDWKQAPKLADLEDGLAAYRRLQGPEKANELRWQLACAAGVRGHHEVALKLVPPGRNAADLPPTLRDLRPQGPGGA